MQSNKSEQKISSNQKLPYEGSQKEKKNDDTTSPKTLRQNKSIITSKSPILRNTSPVSQLMQIKNIKNDEFLFRMKLKFIACMQQLQIAKDDIEGLRKQQGDSDILNFFLNPVKKQFATLKKIKDQYMLKQSRGQLSKNNAKSLQSLEMISLSSQLQQFSQVQKKLKLRCQKLFTQNTQLIQKLKKKQQQNEQNQNNLYQTKLLLKQYQSVIQNLKQSSKKIQRDFGQQKQRLNQQINGLKEVLLRQRQAKQIYLSKLQTFQINLQDKDAIVKRLGDEILGLNKECIKWKNRAQWREKQSDHETKSIQQKVYQLQAEIQKLNQNIQGKQTQIVLLKKQAQNSVQSYNKKLEKIVEQWKAKLIENVEQYEVIIQKNEEKLAQLGKENQKIRQEMQDKLTKYQKFKIQNERLTKQLDIKAQCISQIQSKLTIEESQSKQKQQFYSKKITDLECIINQLKSQLSSKSTLITQLTKSLQQVEKTLKQKKQAQNKLTQKLSISQNNWIIQQAKLKKQNSDKIKEIQKLKTRINEIETQKIQLIKDLERTEKQLREKQQIILQKQNSSQLLRLNNDNNSVSLQSSMHSVNNSINTGNHVSSQQTISRTNRFTVESYQKNDRPKSIRRVFVRSNSINQYLKDHLRQNSESVAAYNALNTGRQSFEKKQKVSLQQSSKE